jgi:hypothetical protein
MSAGEAGRGVERRPAKRELGWQPVYACWREGFLRGLDGATQQQAQPQAA